MKTLATLLSLAVLVTVSTCMSLQEYEEDDMTSRNPSWGIHIHFHFHELAKRPPPVPVCEDGKWRMCAKQKYEVEIKGQAKVIFPFDGCLEVSKVSKTEISLQLVMGTQKFYKNTYERFNGDDMLPCVTSKNSDKAVAEMCPKLYDVSVKKGKLCAKIYENLHINNSFLKHEIELGCIKFNKCFKM